MTLFVLFEGSVDHLIKQRVYLIIHHHVSVLATLYQRCQLPTKLQAKQRSYEPSNEVTSQATELQAKQRSYEPSNEVTSKQRSYKPIIRTLLNSIIIICPLEADIIELNLHNSNTSIIRTIIVSPMKVRITETVFGLFFFSS